MRSETWLFRNARVVVPATHRILADSGYVGVDDQLLICYDHRAATPAERDRNEAITYMRSLAENCIGWSCCRPVRGVAMRFAL